MAGQDDEFRAWALVGRPRLRQTAFLLTGDWYLADDLVQECLVRLYDAWPRVGGSPSLQAYARRVLVNLVTDHRRRPARREQPAEEVPDRPVDDTDARVDRDRLVSALREVPPRQRAVLVLRFFDDLSVEQTAGVLGTTAGTVKSQTHRGLEALRHALAERGLAATFDLQEMP